MTCSALLRSSRYAPWGAADGVGDGCAVALAAGGFVADAVGVAGPPPPACGPAVHAIVSAAIRVTISAPNLLIVMDETQSARCGQASSESDAEPEAVSWINDSTRPLILAIPPRDAAKLAFGIAEQTDEKVAALPPEKMWPLDTTCPLNPLRASHRGEHLDEIEAA